MPGFSAPSIFIYFDYREYLADFYARRKAADPAFSHRAFLKLAGIAGSVYLLRIIRKERKLTGRFIDRISAALGHTPREARYFRCLVMFQNEKKAPRKEEFLRELLQLRTSTPKLKLEDQKLRYFEKWYHPVIRELAVMEDFGEDWHRLATAVTPTITPQQAESAVRYLLSNGFLRRNASGRYAHAQAILTTGPEVSSTIVRKYHQELLIQTADALDTVDRGERDVTSITFGVSFETFQEIKKETQAFRKRLLQLAKDDPRPATQVCMLGLQLIPRSRREKAGPA